MPASPAELTRSILESLATAYADGHRPGGEAQWARGRPWSTSSAGAARTRCSCQLTADRTGRTVLAGPVEATALGNVLVQARAAGLVDPDWPSSAILVARTHPPQEYRPR